YRGTVEISVYVDENFQRRRVARRLLEHAITHASHLGIRAMVGLIFADNAASVRLFERLRFARWGSLPRVARADNIERDLVIMGRHHDTHRPGAIVMRPDAQLHDVFELMHTLMQYRQQPSTASSTKFGNDTRCSISMCSSSSIISQRYVRDRFWRLA